MILQETLFMNQVVLPVEITKLLLFYHISLNNCMLTIFNFITLNFDHLGSAVWGKTYLTNLANRVLLKELNIFKFPTFYILFRL